MRNNEPVHGCQNVNNWRITRGYVIPLRMNDTQAGANGGAAGRPLGNKTTAAGLPGQNPVTVASVSGQNESLVGYL